MTNENLLNGVEPEQEEKSIDEMEQETANEETSEQEDAKMPEGLEPELWDEENKSVKQDDLLKAYNSEKEKALGLRRKLSEKGNIKPPKAVEEYTIDESVNELLPSDSPVANILKDKAFKAGMSKDQFDVFVKELMPALDKEGVIQKPEAEMSSEEKEAAFAKRQEEEFSKVGPDAPKVVQKLVNWGNGMVNKGILSKDELSHFNDMAFSGETIVILNKIMGAYTDEPAIPVKTAVKDGLPSRAEIDQIIASPEYEAGDAKLHAQVKNYFETMSS